jgi:hypothetical protein
VARHRRRLLSLLAAGGLAACGSGPDADGAAAPSTTAAPAASTSTTGPAVRTWRISRDGRPVLLVTDRPGVLVSRAAPPPDPGQPPVTHPFLSASSLEASTEAELRALLEGQPDVESYLAALRRAGFVVEPA